MIRRVLCTSLLSLFMAGPVWGQDAGLLDTSGAVNILSFSTNPSTIGVETCDLTDTSGLNQTVSVLSSYASLTVDSLERQVNLFFYTSETCKAQLADVTDCPTTQSGDTGLCGCLHTWTTADLANTHSFALADTIGTADTGLDTSVCQEPGAPIYLFQRILQVDGDSVEIEADSDPIAIGVDLLAPTAPSNAPTITPGDTKLRVEIDYSSETPDNYEICACANTTSTGGGDECANCETVSHPLPSAGHEFTQQIVNGVPYEVTYRVLDSAGNKSDLSPIGSGTPQELWDFAEVYESWSKGRGEQGGCALGATEGFPLAWLTLFVVLGGIVLRRRQS